MKLTKNFSLDEFIESRFYDEESQEKVWESYNENLGELLTYISKLASNLQTLRDSIKKPVSINISYRPVWWEHKQGRSGNSQHCLGKAADIVVPGMTPDEVADKIEELISNGDMLQGGLGRYKSFTHYDIRKTKARWNG
jgi:uncharacterized protein YcbK (DUF882 family)